MSHPLHLLASPYPIKAFLPLLLRSPPPLPSPHRRRFFSSIRKSVSGTMTTPAATSSWSSARPPTPRILSGNAVGISRKLWTKFSRDSVFSIYTPFLIALAAGNLRLDTFRHYIAQDVHFLKAFVQAYQIAEDYADDDDERAAISELRKGVIREFQMHDSFMQEWGSELLKGCPLYSATTKYTDFLLDTASGKIEGIKAAGKLATPFEKTKLPAYTLGAMTPCMRLYAHIGKELTAVLDLDQKNHAYKKWIDNYSVEDFQKSALQTEDLLDKLSASLTGEELDVIEKLYQQAMRLETGFFLAQSLVQPTVVPLSKALTPAEWRLMLFSDFDLTCSVIDSSSILAEIAIITAPKSDQDKSEEEMVPISSAELRNAWSVLSRQYTEEHEQCIESILKTEKEEKFSYQHLHKELELLSDFEKAANARVVESGVLKGINLEDVRKAGGRLILHEGCAGFFQKVVQNENLDAEVHVLSYCWCGDLIRAVFSSGGLHDLNIHANEFVYDESISTGEILKKVETPHDKVEAFSKMLENNRSNKKQLTVYIGDSVGDLLCLVKADIGIVVGTSQSLSRVGSHFGVAFVPLFQGLVKKQQEHVEGSPLKWNGLSGILYTVSSWAEIHAFILGS